MASKRRSSITVPANIQRSAAVTQSQYNAPLGSYTRPPERAPTPVSCRQVRERGACYQEDYKDYPETGLENFRQMIMNSIARKNVLDKGKNAFLLRGFTRTKDEKNVADDKREADIRGVLKNIAYSSMALKDYTVSSLIDAPNAQLRSAGHALAEAGRRGLGYESKDGTLSGSQTRTGGRKSRRYKTKKAKRTRKYR